MPWYRVETTCEATVREQWRIFSPDGPPTAEEAAARLSRGGDDCVFIDEAAEDEQHRQIESVQPWPSVDFADPDRSVQGAPCDTCDDGAVVSDTCDLCGERHCPDCGPCEDDDPISDDERSNGPRHR
jgi:hypothetical protein